MKPPMAKRAPNHAFPQCPYSSGVEHSLGKGEVVSSNLTMGTILSPEITNIFVYTDLLSPRGNSVFAVRFRKKIPIFYLFGFPVNYFYYEIIILGAAFLAPIVQQF